MNLKQRRTLNRAERRERLNAARDNLKNQVLAKRLTDEVDPFGARHLIRAVDSCRNLGDIYKARRLVDNTGTHP